MLFDLSEILCKYNISNVIHLGAHKCEELPIYKKNNIKKIIWVDANPNIKVDNQKIYNFAASNTNTGYAILNIANNSQSSSFFNFNTHKIHYPETFFLKKIKIENKRTDTFILELGLGEKFDMVNIHLQGSELIALQGMTGIIKDFKCILTKVHRNFVYEQNPFLQEITEFLEKYGFKLENVKWTDKDWGEAIYTQ